MEDDKKKPTYTILGPPHSRGKLLASSFLHLHPFVVGQRTPDRAIVSKKN
jgi:hypothetical protein